MTISLARGVAAVTLATLALTTLAACGDDEGESASATPTSTAPVDDVTITVFAAASLKASFTEIGAAFEKANPGVTVTFNFAGSSDLVTQIQSGAPADVFASADTKNMDKLSADQLEQAPENFASNTLEIATAPDNPKDIESLADLTKPGLLVVLCAPAVPCGSAAAKVEQTAGIDIMPVSEEQSVTDVLGKVTSGQADAGLVYVTDIEAAGDSVEGVEFPEADSAVNIYPIAPLANSKNADIAAKFTAFVLGTTGQKILADAGFAKP